MCGSRRKMKEQSIYSGILMLSLLLIILVLEVRGDQICPWGKYGDACDKNCSERCRISPDLGIIHCDRTSGSCSEGCIPGWYDAKCTQECSKNCINNTCNHQDGVCTLGCIDGKKGTFCEVSEEENEPKVTESTTDPWKNPSPVLITVVVVITLVILISVMIGYVCLHQKYARRQDLIAATPVPKRRVPEADCNLLEASREGDMAAVKRILAAGRVDVNCRDVNGITSVMWAAQGGHRDVVELLVSKGADVSLVDSDGDNILHRACAGGDVKTVKFVLSLNEVNINSREGGSWTPVMLAAWGGHLVSEGADVSLATNGGNTILHFACGGGNVETVKYVLSQNVVDIDARNKIGQTAADLARREGHKEVVKLFSRLPVT